MEADSTPISEKKISIQPLFRERTILKEQIIDNLGSEALKLRVSETQAFNKDFSDEVANVRILVDTALVNEDLLQRFTHQDDSRDFYAHYLPQLLRELIAKAGIRVDADEFATMRHIFHYSNPIASLYVEHAQEDSLYPAITEYANAYFRSKYILETAGRAKDILEVLLPTTYREFPYTATIVNIKNYVNAEHRKFDEGQHEIKIYTAEPLDDQMEYATQETEGVFEKGYKFRRRVADLISVVHEYAHGIYAEIVNPEDKKAKSGSGYYVTFDAALNEGFAVMVELLVCDRLLANAKDYGLDNRDIQDLKERKKQRIRSLHRYYHGARNDVGKAVDSNNKGMAYTQGVLNLMHKIYKETGIEGIEKLVKAIDIDKTLSVDRKSSDYARTIGNPRLILSIFGKQELL